MKRKTSGTAYHVPLFDWVFPPRTIALPNGHTVQKPVSRVPLITVIVIAVILI